MITKSLRILLDPIQLQGLGIPADNQQKPAEVGPPPLRTSVPFAAVPVICVVRDNTQNSAGFTEDPSFGLGHAAKSNQNAAK
ncbi:MAG TPA: hypothetical protein DCG12_24285 [Planctomycetaceae bacterium]|nr:hypothetical protein [Planctomycetaceae bacterium]